MSPVPRSVFEGEYPDTLEHPLRRLTARCVTGWHEVIVGTPFRFSDENIQLKPDVDTSYEQWLEWRLTNDRSRHGYPRVVWLWCRVCNRRRKMAPKGATNGTACPDCNGSGVERLPRGDYTKRVNCSSCGGL